MAKELTKVELEERFVASLRKDQARAMHGDLVTMSNQSVGLAMALAERRGCTYDEVIEWADENVRPEGVYERIKRVVNEWVVTASGPGAFEWGFHCHRCDMHVERLTAEEARAIAGSHAHRVEAGCGFCRDHLTAEQMLAEGRTLCRSCHDAVSELLAPAVTPDPYPELSDAEEAAEEATWD